MPALICAGRQCLRPKIRKSIRAAAHVREEDRILRCRQPVERFQRLRLQRDRPRAQPGLRVLEPAVRVGATNVDDTELAVDVALVEPEQLRRPQSGRGREDHHRPVHRAELRGHGFDLPPRLEWPLLLRPPRRVGDAQLGRVVVEQSPGDRAVENLPERLRRLEAMPLRDAQPPRVHVPRRQIRQPLLAELRGRFAEQPAQLRDRHRRRLMHLQVLVHELGERDRRPPASRPEPVEHLPQRLLRLRPRREPADLRPLRAATLNPVPVRPQRLTVRDPSPSA